MIIFQSWFVVDAKQPDQVETSLVVTQFESNLIFAGRTMPNASVTILVFRGIHCLPRASVANFTTHSGPSGSFEVTVSGVPNNQFPVGSYSAGAQAISPIAFSSSGCTLFSVTYPVPEFSQLTLFATFTIVLSMLAIVRKARSR